MNQKRQPRGTDVGGQFAPDINPESTVVLDCGEPQGAPVGRQSAQDRKPEGVDLVSPTMSVAENVRYEEAHGLYERGGKALTDRQTPLEQAHTHSQLASDYMKASTNAGGEETDLGHRHALTAKAHNSASKSWQSLYDHKGDETSAIQASQRAAESGRKASEEAGHINAISTTENTGYKSQAARDAQAHNYGDESYWDYLDTHAVELASKGVSDALTRSLSDALRGNEGI